MTLFACFRVNLAKTGLQGLPVCPVHKVGQVLGGYPELRVTVVEMVAPVIRDLMARLEKKVSPDSQAIKALQADVVVKVIGVSPVTRDLVEVPGSLDLLVVPGLKDVKENEDKRYVEIFAIKTLFKNLKYCLCFQLLLSCDIVTNFSPI